MKKSFTLIELLVVIAIIAVLAGMLLPALQKAREKGQQADCMNNMKTLALGAQMYVNDYKSYLPLARAGVNYTGRKGTVNAADVKAWIGKGTSDYNLSAGTLFTFVGEEDKVYGCGSSDSENATSYLMNGNLAKGSSAPYTGTKMTSITSASSKALFLECDYTYGDGSDGSHTSGSLAMNHNGGKSNNYAFCDGHVALESWSTSDSEYTSAL